MLKRLSSLSRKSTPRIATGGAQEGHKKAATTLQANWRGRAARMAGSSKNLKASAATRLQASWRGNLVRSGKQAKSVMKQASNAVGNGLGLGSKSSAEQRFEAERKRMASFFFAGKEPGAQLDLLSELQKDVTKRKTPAVAKRKEDWTFQAPAAAEKPPPVAEASTNTRSASAIQARFRGKQARKQAADAKAQSSAAAPALPPSTPPSFARALLKAVPAAAVAWLLATATPRLFSFLCYVAALLLALYGWLRLPYGLGWLASELITRLALNGYPLRMRTLRVRPWLQLKPLTLHADVHVTGFCFANPPGCASEHFVSANDVHGIASVDLSQHLAHGAAAGPLRVRIPRFNIRGVLINLMMSKTGEFNINGLVRSLATGEVRAAVGGVGLHLHRKLVLPNVLRVRVLSVRGLRSRPKLKPRVVVRIRSMQLSTGEGKPTSGAGSGAAIAEDSVSIGDEASVAGLSAATSSETVFTFEDATSDLYFPLSDPSAVIHVQVFNGATTALLGQWLMTTKYLLTAPRHCKHAKGSLTVGKKGAIAGSFLLSDAKLRGSAVRGHGPHSVGDSEARKSGASCGELEMMLQWAHSELVPVQPPQKPRPAMDQVRPHTRTRTHRTHRTHRHTRAVCMRMPLHVPLHACDAYLLGSSTRTRRPTRCGWATCSSCAAS